MELNKRKLPIPKPRRSGPLRVPPAVQIAVKDYKAAYKAVYGILPQMRWNGTWIRLPGQNQGVSAKRLREMTAQLRRRVA